jgi:hypothetical protein
MGHEGSDWLMRQATSSALLLVETPTVLLDPVGRSLRELASQWDMMSGELRGVPEVDQPTRKQARKRVKKPPNTSDSMQPPLMNVLDGQTD